MTQPVFEALIPDCTGVLLAGGAGTRLGGLPKGLLQVDGEPILARTLRLFSRLFPASLVVANDPAPYRSFGAPIVGDVVPGKGAPGGLHSALHAATTSWIFVVGCDMPFLDPGPIAWLAGQRAGNVAAVVWHGHVEPLHAFWSRACLPAVEEALRTGDPSLREVATLAGARLVPELAWRERDPDGRAFTNVNTPAEADTLNVKIPRS